MDKLAVYIALVYAYFIFILNRGLCQDTTTTSTTTTTTAAPSTNISCKENGYFGCEVIEESKCDYYSCTYYPDYNLWIVQKFKCPMNTTWNDNSKKCLRLETTTKAPNSTVAPETLTTSKAGKGECPKGQLMDKDKLCFYPDPDPE